MTVNNTHSYKIITDDFGNSIPVVEFYFPSISVPHHKFFIQRPIHWK